MTDSESKRTEYLWDQMSVMERCEVLRSEVKELRLKQIASRIKTYPMSDGERLDDLARRVAEIEGREHHFAGTDNDQSRHIADLQRRVAELEKSHTETMLGHFHGNHARVDVEMCPNNEGVPKSLCASCTPTFDPIVSIKVADLARLRRIEEAARVVLNNCEARQRENNDCDDWEAHIDLGCALDSEPERGAVKSKQCGG